jgi:hypothetical protein
MPTAIYSDGNFLKIVSDAITTLVPKSNIIIQKDNKDTFFIKATNFIKYFKIADITYPLNGADGSVTIDNLLDSIRESVDDSSAGGGSMNGITNSDLIYQVSVNNDENYYKLETLQRDHTATEVYIKNGLSYDATSGTVSMTTSDDEIEDIIRQSREYIEVPFGSTISTMITAQLTGKNSMIGMFDDQNGVFLKATDSVSIEIVLRSNGVDVTTIDSTMWNIDKADGSGLSGITLDLTKFYTWVFIMGNIQGSVVKVGLYQNDDLYLLHEVSDDTYHLEGSLPVRLQIVDTTGLTEMKHKNVAVYAVSKQTIIPNRISVMNQDETRLHTTNTTEGFYKMVCSSKLHPTYKNSKMVMKSINILSTTASSMVEYKLVMDNKLAHYKSVGDAIKLYYDSTSSATVELYYSLVVFSNVFAGSSGTLTPKLDSYQKVFNGIMQYLNNPDTVLEVNGSDITIRDYIISVIETAYPGHAEIATVLNDDTAYPLVHNKIDNLDVNNQAALDADTHLLASILNFVINLDTFLPTVQYPANTTNNSSYVLYSETITQLETGYNASMFPHYGHVIASGYLKGADEKTIVFSENNMVVSSDILGNAYEVSLFCKSLNTTQTDVYAGLTWDEYH